jgi:Fe-S-cluster containining protein
MKPCTQCGKCCTNERWMNTLEATGDDVKRWRRQKRYDILQHAFVLGPKDNPFADLWVTPDGNDVRRCPFVRKIRGVPRHTCTIYDTRPQVCRDFPFYADQRRDCEMIEPGDTNDDVDRFMGRPPTIAKD